MSLFEKAKNEQGKFKINIYGEPGSGKSFTSLLLAEGLAKKENKKIAVIDSEGGYDFYSETIQSRAIHKDGFNFDIMKTKSIFEATKAANEAIESNEFGIIIIDSISEFYEAAQEAYTGQRNRAGGLPIHAWKVIKKNYKQLVNPLFNCDKHVIFSGRVGNIYAKEGGDEMKVIGKRMKADGDQAFETQMLFSMSGDDKFSMYIEKDRSSVLLGKTIQYPNFENTLALVLPYMTGEHKQIEVKDDVTTAVEKQQSSLIELKKMKSKIDKTTNKKDLENLKPELAKSKKKMETQEVAELAECYSVKINSFNTKSNSVLDKIR